VGKHIIHKSPQFAFLLVEVGTGDIHKSMPFAFLLTEVGTDNLKVRNLPFYQQR